MRTLPVMLAAFLPLAACDRKTKAGPGSPASVAPGPPVVKVTGYPPFELAMLGDSSCGLISEDPRIEFDGGPLSGSLARDSDPHCVINRTARNRVATIPRPPAGVESDDFPIDVMTSDRDVEDAELKRLTFAIEKAVLPP